MNLCPRRLRALAEEIQYPEMILAQWGAERSVFNVGHGDLADTSMEHIADVVDQVTKP
jgi:uroporphyrinogen-III decarboxylase